MFGRFSSNKCKTQAKLCIGRVRLMRNKRQIAMKQMRKEVADLLRSNKEENARIRVEAVIREINLLQAYEVLEIFLELLTVRLQLIENSKDIPNDMFECLASLVYSASRIQDFPELTSIRGMLGSKFGKEFVEKASSDTSCRQFMVNENLIRGDILDSQVVKHGFRCLAIGAPDAEIKLQLLSEIAQEHGVEWDSHRAHQEMVAGGMSRGYQPYNQGGGPPSNFGGPGGPPSNFGGPPSNFGGPAGFGGGSGGSFGGSEPQSPIYAPPPGDMASPGGVPFVPPPVQESKFKRALKKVPTLGKNSPQPPVNIPQAGYGDSEWTDAASAASAAREYSQSAQRAADAAQRFASSNTSSADLGVQSPNTTSPVRARPAPQGPHATAQYPDLQPGMGGPPSAPPQGGNRDYPDIKPPSTGGDNFKPMSSNLPNTGPSQPPIQPQGPPQYRQRTDEEIQRDYDAAGGPPNKAAKSQPPSASPSAPPAPNENQQDSETSGGVGGASSPVNNAKASSGGDGIDKDLAARFEALKRG